MKPTDPRLAALYDIDNPDGLDHDHFRNLADRLDADVIVDLGCGTGILTVTLATGRRTVVGIDPDAGMLAVARQRAGTERVRWVLGDSQQIGDAGADLVMMTGNVAQHVGPSEWRRTLADIAAGLRSGGMVSFESRNPTVKPWRMWPGDGIASTRDTLYGQLTEWLDVTEPDGDGTVLLTAHNLWQDTGDDLVVTQPLTFRTLDLVTDDLASVGLSVTDVRGGWSGQTFTETSPIMVVAATRA